MRFTIEIRLLVDVVKRIVLNVGTEILHYYNDVTVLQTAVLMFLICQRKLTKSANPMIVQIWLRNIIHSVDHLYLRSLHITCALVEKAKCRFDYDLR